LAFIFGAAVAVIAAAAAALAVRIGQGGEGRVSRAAFRAQMAKPRPPSISTAYGFQLTVHP
jgi:hypothetical protein